MYEEKEANKERKQQTKIRHCKEERRETGNLTERLINSKGKKFLEIYREERERGEGATWREKRKGDVKNQQMRIDTHHEGGRNGGD